MDFPGSVELSGSDILKITATKSFPLGTRGFTRDGRAFRYAKNGATALKAGRLVQSAVPLAGELLLGTGTTKLKANSTKVNVMSTSHSATGILVTRNTYADGYLYLGTSSTAKGCGQYAQIKVQSSCPATSVVKIPIEFYSGDGFYSGTSVIGSTNASVHIIKNPYDSVIVKPAGLQTSMCVGVPVRPVTASYYFWVQTWGPCPVKSTGIIDVGNAAGPSSDATNAGQVDGVTDTDKTSKAEGLVWSVIRSALGDKIGQTMVAGAAGKCRMIFLKLAP